MHVYGDFTYVKKGGKLYCGGHSKLSLSSMFIIDTTEMVGDEVEVYAVCNVTLKSFPISTKTRARPHN